MSQDKIEKLTLRIADLENQKRKILAKQKEQDRKNDTRKKIILGSIYLKLISDGVLNHTHIQRHIDKYCNSKDTNFLKQFDNFSNIHSNLQSTSQQSSSLLNNKSR